MSLLSDSSGRQRKPESITPDALLLGAAHFYLPLVATIGQIESCRVLEQLWVAAGVALKTVLDSDAELGAVAASRGLRQDL